MFGLTAIDDDGTVLHLRRHRLFESNVFLLLPALCHHERAKPVGGVYGGGLGRRARTKQIGRGGYTPSARVRSALLGIDWMTQVGLAEAIPPAYTEWIGAQLIDALVSGGSSW
jgi:DNA (cytosine-5)-methyltransferase 1